MNKKLEDDDYTLEDLKSVQTISYANHELLWIEERARKMGNLLSSINALQLVAAFMLKEQEDIDPNEEDGRQQNLNDFAKNGFFLGGILDSIDFLANDALGSLWAVLETLQGGINRANKQARV